MAGHKRKGRPPAGAALRAHVIEVRVSVAELAQIRAAAARCRRPVSTFMRDAALGVRLSPPLPIEAFAMASTMARAAQALEGVAKAAAAGNVVGVPVEFVARVAALVTEAGLGVLRGDVP